MGSGAGSGDEDVDDAAGAGLPTRVSRGVEDAYKGADEVGGIGAGTKIAVLDGVLDEGGKGAVNGCAGAFDETSGTSRDGVHRGQDEGLCGDVIDEQEHPGAESFEGRQGDGEAPGGGGELFHFTAVDGLDE